jgi:hypothetical protein
MFRLVELFVSCASKSARFCGCSSVRIFHPVCIAGEGKVSDGYICNTAYALASLCLGFDL